MLSKTILAFAGLIAAAQAILVTSPAKDSKLDFSSTIKVEWTSVNTDPTTFELVLVDQNNMTPISISKGVKSSDHEYTLSNFAANPGTYKFNFLSEDPLNTGILAQSQTFTITKSGGAEESESSSSSTITTSTSTPSKTSGASNASNTADASSTGTAPVKSDNAAAALNGKTFGIAGGLFAGLLMLF
ncbi:hypothetical protein GE09DRAFT_1107902 [Coniochaeta sp. 2T2.1]|nr:hypothetical protein GE09DRAFT_1107902 [Coniochaeta sp. 2T2.1]